MISGTLILPSDYIVVIFMSTILGIVLKDEDATECETGFLFKKGRHSAWSLSDKRKGPQAPPREGAE